ncbi:nucleoside triphosphate pyrophosphohydrolase [Oleiagrimonas sp. C23AA]|uniref:nucleoside triphosphate pyrophosphohydrolase n=1 Tax=Oleiagrimonas sp. C23AA TaxID=2719047 RepID=UPI0014236B61|nr:nucleoside triphosphate pyrophosphohydrolase [Oleiagrimonas sp. C23AA]NII11414.1 nucleoside triphosphate pyrophosphohydrolase [Oleiagrimonas sp. C23AA]
MSVQAPPEPRRQIEVLLAIMAQLRDPQSGCPWDVKQDFDSIGAYTLEEAYEVIDAIDRRDMDDLRDELGDLLLQVVFHARMAEERGAFAFADVVQAISDKMVRRHPHVFGDTRFDDAQAQTRAWEQIKAEERRQRGSEDASALAGIARGLPEHKRAAKLQKRAATVGFDWPSPVPVLDKAAEELDEVRAEFERGDTDALEEEIGDLLFVAVNLCRHGRVDFSRALRRANAKFEQRFRAMEAEAAEAGRTLESYDLAAQETLWQNAKRR